MFSVYNPRAGETVARILPGQIVEIFLDEKGLHTDPVVKIEGERLNFLIKNQIDHIYKINHTKKSRRVEDFPFFLGIIWVKSSCVISKIVVLLDDGSKPTLSNKKNKKKRKRNKRKIVKDLFFKNVIEKNVEFKIIEFLEFNECCNTAPIDFLNFGFLKKGIGYERNFEEEERCRRICKH